LRRILQTISVIIPARDAEATIGKTLANLSPDSDLIGEIVLVDDGSEDETIQVARAAAGRHRLPLRIVTADARNAGAARNIGYSQCRCPLVYFIDADDHVEPEGLRKLHRALDADLKIGLAVGAHVRRTEGRPDKRKAPNGYSNDRRHNVRNYLLGEMWPIAMGSALFRRAAADGIRFPEGAVLDEDTCFWAELMARTEVVSLDDTVLVYQLNEARMARRYSATPRSSFLGVARALNGLAPAIVDREVVQWRKAWVALRIARHLIYERRYEEARHMLRLVAAHPTFARSWKLTRYRVRTGAGLALTKRRSPIQPNSPMPNPAAGTYKTFILTGDPAWPPVSGADLRNAQNALAASAFGPVILASIMPVSRHEPAPENVKVVSVSDGSCGDRGSPIQQKQRFEVLVAGMALKIVDLVQQFRPDAIIVEGIHLHDMLHRLRPLTPLLVLDMHNIESELSALIRKTTPRRTLKSILGLEVSKIRRQERKASRLVDRIWVCSEEDATRLYRLHSPPVSIDVVPNGIPRCDRLPDRLPARDESTDGPVILYFSHLGYRPNITAARRLAVGIMPIVRQKLPMARLHLAGRSPSQKIANLTDFPGVMLTGDPPDADAILAGADFVVVPLEAGGGTRLKILEAMAWGLPVIATPIAAEGLGLDEGDDYVPATTDNEFAREIIDMWSDRERFEKVRSRAHETVLRRFGLAAIERSVRNGLGLTASGKATDYHQTGASAE